MFEEDFELPKLKSEPNPMDSLVDAAKNDNTDVTSSFEEDDKQEVSFIEETPLVIPGFNEIDESTLEIPTLKGKAKNPLIVDNLPIESDIQDASIKPADNEAFSFDPSLAFGTPQEEIPSFDIAFNSHEINEEAASPSIETVIPEIPQVEELIIPPLFGPPAFEFPSQDEQIFNNQIDVPINESIVPEISDNAQPIETLEPLAQTEELETFTISLDPSELQAMNQGGTTDSALPLQTEETIQSLPDALAPSPGETVIYQTPEASYEFQVDVSANEGIESDFEEYIEKAPQKKDPFVVVSTLLIIASIIMAAVYFFVTGGDGTPFAKKSTTTTTTIPVPTPNPKTWPVEGTYTESEKKVCNDLAVELILNEDKTYTFNDLKYDSKSKKCSKIESKGTYIIEENTLTLNADDKSKINAVHNDLQSHAEIIITGANNTPITLYRLADA